jgi:acetolactate synthase-1/2/3 large subunit
VTAATCEFAYRVDPDEVLQPHGEGHPGQIRKAVDALLEAHRPVLYIGGG